MFFRKHVKLITHFVELLNLAQDAFEGMVDTAFLGPKERIPRFYCDELAF